MGENPEVNTMSTSQVNRNKRFIVRKYIMAQSAADAIKDVWVDDDYKKDNEIGFVTNK